MYQQVAKQTRDRATTMPKPADHSAAAQAIAIGPRQAAQRKLGDQVDASPRQRASSARLQALSGDGAPVQRVKDKGDKLAAKVQAAWVEVSSLDAKQFVDWCETEQEVDEWLDYQTFAEWTTLCKHAPNEHDPGKIADILDRPAEGPKVVAPRKVQAVESEEAKQIRIRLEYEERLAAEKKQLALTRTARLTTHNLIPTPAAFTADPLVEDVWNAARDCYIRGGTNNMSISGTHDKAVVNAAMAVWRNIQPSGLITYISRFAQVQDKSERDDGGKNAANLDTRAVQGNFIITIDGQTINVHVNVA